MNERKIALTTLSISTLIALSVKLYLIKYSHGAFPNYLYLEAMNLNQHLIHSPQEKMSPLPSYFFLGTSSMAGSNVPERSTLPDLFQELNPQIRAYNLASHQSNILDIFSYFLMAIEERRPTKIFLGLNSDIFLENITAKQVTFSYLPKLKPFLNDETLNKLTINSWKSGYPLFKLFNPKGTFNITHNIILKLKETIFATRNELYGQMMDKNVYGKYGKKLNHVFDDKITFNLISKIRDIASSQNAELIVILEPEISKNDPQIERPFAGYEKYVISKLQDLNIKTLNYIGLLNRSEKYFVDYIHLTPQGYKAVATALTNDLNGGAR